MNKWDYVCFMVLAVGLNEAGGKLSQHNDILGMVLGLTGMFLFFFVTVELYRFTNGHKDSEENGNNSTKRCSSCRWRVHVCNHVSDCNG